MSPPCSALPSLAHAFPPGSHRANRTGPSVFVPLLRSGGGGDSVSDTSLQPAGRCSSRKPGLGARPHLPTGLRRRAGGCPPTSRALPLPARAPG